MEAKSKKWALGSILGISYAGFFILTGAGGNIGVLPLVIITCIWAWLFYKATGIDFGLFSEESKKETRTDDQS